MFRAELKCKNCEFASDSFTIGYFPPGDSVDFVFQNMVNSRIRIVSCDEISRQLTSATPTEKELDAVVAMLGSEVKREDEELLNVWVAPDEFTNRRCPHCHQQRVVLKLLSIV